MAALVSIRPHKVVVRFEKHGKWQSPQITLPEQLLKQYTIQQYTLHTLSQYHFLTCISRFCPMIVWTRHRASSCQLWLAIFNLIVHAKLRRQYRNWYCHVAILVVCAHEVTQICIEPRYFVYRIFDLNWKEFVNCSIQFLHSRSMGQPI